MSYPPGRNPSSSSVAELRAPPRHKLLELGAERVVERRLLVGLERRSPDLAGALGRVAAAVSAPAVEVLSRREQRAVEALAEALERVHGTEEVAARANLLVG